jgi:hypothetical protein
MKSILIKNKDKKLPKVRFLIDELKESDQYIIHFKYNLSQYFCANAYYIDYWKQYGLDHPLYALIKELNSDEQTSNITIILKHPPRYTIF